MQAMTAFSSASAGALTSAQREDNQLTTFPQQTLTNLQLTSNRQASLDVPQPLDRVKLIVLVPRVVDQGETLARTIRSRILLVKPFWSRNHLQHLAIPIVRLPDKLGIGFRRGSHRAAKNIKDDLHHLVFPPSSLVDRSVLGHVGSLFLEEIHDLSEFQPEFTEFGGDDRVDGSRGRGGERFRVNRLRDDSVFLSPRPVNLLSAWAPLVSPPGNTWRRTHLDNIDGHIELTTIPNRVSVEISHNPRIDRFFNEV